MANPLKMLKLKAYGFQFIQEMPINAPPARAWNAVLNTKGWFFFKEMDWLPATLEPHLGGRFMETSKDRSIQMLAGIVTHIEPEKLLRINGPMGMSHLPVNNVLIWELQPKANGTKTLLRFAQRAYGYMTPDQSKKYQGGWKILLPQLKALAEAKKTKR